MSTSSSGAKTVQRAQPASLEDLLRAHRRELLVHCYRMLGSWTDAEDVLQEVAVRAWRGLDRFEGRSSARSWLYRIATNACLSALKSRSRRSLPELSVRPAAAGDAPAPPIEGARWIQPLPAGAAAGDEATSREAVTLAFVLALQQLPPRQRAALLLRDVVGYEAGEVAPMLKTSTAAVNSALVRARERMERFRRQHGGEVRTTALSAAQRQLLRRYVEAWEAGDVDAIVALLSRDAIVSMPPFATWYRGREAIVLWLRRVFSEGRSFRLVPTVANGAPAFALYKSGGPCLPGEAAHDELAPHCVQMVWQARGRITRVVSFLNARLVEAFAGPPPARRAKKK
jgi:RNA polymerase sigma-70 factor (ECF subfamily)